MMDETDSRRKADAAFLAPQSLFILGQGAVGGGGSFTIKVDLPDNPALIGLNVFGQGALRHADGSLTLTTSDRKVID